MRGARYGAEGVAEAFAFLAARPSDKPRDPVERVLLLALDVPQARREDPRNSREAGTRARPPRSR